MSNTQKAIDRVCEYRELPEVKKGQRCTVDTKPGVIWGGNSSANFNVKFDSNKQVLNCHPGWKMKIFIDNSSDLLYSSEDN